jgi:UDP-N-acetylglucosamine transferase subunit ALG13
MLSYAVVTPVRDEAPDLPRLAGCMAAQTHLPVAWVIVDNGSVDGTPRIAAELAREHDWIRVRRVPGQPVATRGAPVVRALRAGIEALGELPDVVVKVDADVSVGADHFARLTAEFAADGALGIASGTRHELQDDQWRRCHVTGTSVEGQCRAYRRRCLADVWPLEERIGWDGLDEMKANVLGWRTRTLRDLPFRHHRTVGERDASRIAAWVVQGRANHYMGYRPYYALLRALHRARRDATALALAWGYVAAAARGSPRCPDTGVRDYVRRQQGLRRLPARVREARGRAGEVDVLLVSQAGGHLMELIGLRRAWEPFSRAWVTIGSAGAQSLLRGERVVYASGPGPRSLDRLARNLVLAWRTLRRLRPSAVVTTGGAPAVPFAWIARALGIRVVYVECGGRVDGASLTGRLIAPVAHRVYVQWPELVTALPGARYRGRVRFSDALLPSVPAPAGVTTVLSVGTCNYPFDRLVRVADRLPDPGRVMVQGGFSRVQPERARSVDFLPFETLAASVREARTVITHAGIGSVLLARACGKRPIVVPRLPALGENVDDHQIAFARRLAADGLVTLVEDPERLPELLARDGDCAAHPDGEGGDPLAEDILAYLTRSGAL